MENTGEVFSIWVGKHSQELAHHFYALQAQQFFNEQEDPLDHHRLWKLYDIEGQIKRPYSLTFDVEIPHLNYLRQTNHAKIIKQMQKQQMKLEELYFPRQNKLSLNKKDMLIEQKDKYLYSKWQATQDNYCIINKNFVQNSDNFDYWKQIFKANEQTYEDKVRRNLEKLDSLKAFTFCSDLQKNSFSRQLLLYLNDQCSKKPIYFYQIEGKQKPPLHEVHQMHSFAQIGTLAQSFLNINYELFVNPYFQSQNFAVNLAPLFHCLFTPLYLKNSSSNSKYLETILTNPRRNIFDVAYTLPYVDNEQNLSRKTNIFDYLLQNKHDKFFTLQEEQLKKQEEDEKINSKLQTKPKDIQTDQIYDNRINYGSDYLFLRNQKPKGTISKNIIQKNTKLSSLPQLYSGILSEAYVLKGHVNQKTFSSIFSPNSELLDVKYLEGIVCSYLQLKHSKSYLESIHGKNYKTKNGCVQIVQNYPFHTVMFQHKNFADYMRQLAFYKQKKYKNEFQTEWRQNILVQADLYKQIKQEQDD